MPDIESALRERESELVEYMLETLPDVQMSSPEEQRQFVEGYVRIMCAAAGGDNGPRNDYLETVIPGIKEAGMPLSVVMDGMVRVAAAACAVMGKDHGRWIIEFNGQYTTRLLEIWGG